MITITIEGPEHAKKTTTIAAIKKALDSHGVEVQVQQIDPQIDDKLNLTADELTHALQGVKVRILEFQTRGS